MQEQSVPTSRVSTLALSMGVWVVVVVVGGLLGANVMVPRTLVPRFGEPGGHPGARFC
jgi:hypothetical protein